MTQVYLQTSPPTLGFTEPSQYSNELGSMNEIPQFSFPLRSEIGKQAGQVSDNTTLHPSVSAPNQAHRRSRTSIHVAHAPLPSFSFGGPSSEIPEAPLTAPNTQASTECTLAPLLPASRHRRAVSEFIGEQATETQNQTNPASNTQPASSYTPARVAHRHRRSHASGAINTTDLPSFAASSNSAAESKSITSPTSSHSPLVSEYELLPAVVDHALSTSTVTSSEEAVSVVPQTVTFSEHVDTIQPRPISMVSSASSGSQSTIRGISLSRTEDYPSSPPFYDPGPMIITSDLPHELDPSSHIDSDFRTGIDIVDLDENFDSDPTAASTLTTEYGNESVLEDYDVNQPQSLSSVSPSEPLHNYLSADIDLNLASVDANSSPTRTSLRGSGFQKARASMHSAGSQSMLLPSGISMHRRTESAPSLTPVTFLLRSHEKAADAGFEMTDVFEEDEDDCEASSPSSPHAAFLEGRYSSISSLSDQDVTPKPLIGKRETHSSPTLLSPIQFDIWRAKSLRATEARNSHDEGVNLSLPRPPYITTYSEPSASNASSPRYAHSGLSSCEPSPRFQHSVEDVPSLISSGSTVGETTLPNPSLRSFERPAIVAATSQASPAHSTRTHRKRLSIMSMSVSRLFSGSTPTIDESEHLEPPHSYSSAGFKESRTKTRRLTRMLKFWKKPSSSPYSQ